MERFEPRHEGAFLAYLCRIARNLMLDDQRKVQRRPERVELEDNHADDGPTPLEFAIQQDDLEHYEEALFRLPEDFQVAIRLRLELNYSHAEMAAAMERPTENAARLLLQRAVKRLAREMNARRRPGLRP
jgi:RNA polymerase sigma factor (sigma-70 family)